ncbi:hypothetical protein PIB30_056456 [Stylosanthes scabra]|uniref:Cysteine alpha-hairpin motif superfamily n=1 Tax=Stylosanthes scabra TaxID=79078 RepID=A0ABU6XH89_9FABA|nr:hypothetical protein [Stylosanthes scabra]
MESGKGNPKEAVCGEEALQLLNCVTETPFDQDKCQRLLLSLRQCILDKKVKKFSLAGQDQQETKANNKKA